jgi:general secretion pathway protein N
MMRGRTPVLALAGAALVACWSAMAAPDLGVDPGLRAVPRPPAPGLDAPPRDPNPAPALHSGNPLWAVPLSSLTATRERPLFSSSRRPPPAPVAAAPVMQTRAPPPPAPRVPERPRLSLVGTVGGEQGIAVFVDQATQAIVRLRPGEGHDGWVLRAVGGRDVTLQSDRDTAILSLPRPDGR